MKKDHVRKAQPKSSMNLVMPAAATLLLVGLVAAAAMIGREQAAGSRDEAKPAHHMASLGEINSFLHKTQGEQEH